MPEATTIYQRPVELLQNLLRFDTTNPPGNEAECIAYIDDLLHSLGIETTLLEKEPGRPNLIARIKGQGNAAPLLLYGHVDVVPTEGQDWKYPPFAAEIAEGYLWGRGTLDMKGGVAMMLAAFMRAKAENTPLPGDLVLCVVSDEEAGGVMGASFLVDEHADLFEGIKYAIGEFGGFSMEISGKRFYPIQVAEKGICWMKVTIRGAAGHGSMPMPGGTMVRLADVLHALGTERLPVHITPPTEMMFKAIADNLEGDSKQMFESLLDPEQADGVLDEMGEMGRMFNALLHNTASPTVLQASNKINVIPGLITLEIDCRLLPGQTSEDVIHEIRSLVGDDIEIEVVTSKVSAGEINMGWFETLANILKEADPEGIPVPLIMPGATDGRFFEKIGIQSYGFLPMKLPDDYGFLQTIHAANERVSPEAVEFGTEAIFKAIQQFGD